MRILEDAVDEAAAAPAAVGRRIADHRLGNFTLTVIGRDGAAVTDVERLQLTLIRHHFLFGTAVAPEAVREEYGAKVYERYMEVLAENFWR